MRATQSCWDKPVDFQQWETNPFTKFALTDLNGFVRMCHLGHNNEYGTEQRTGQ
jgi:hypothetical protein